MNPVAMGVTPDKDEESQMGTRAGHKATDRKQTTEERKSSQEEDAMDMTDGFLMPSRKHITYVKALSPKSETRIGTRNQYEMLMLQSLGTIRSRKASPGKIPLSKRSKHKELKLHPAIAAALQDGGNSTKGTARDKHYGSTRKG